MKHKLCSMFKFLISPIWGFKTHQHNVFFPEKFTIYRIYKKFFGVYPDLKTPKKLTEKMQWLKLNDRTELHTTCADKILVRDYVKERIGHKYLIPIMRVYDSADQLTLASLPEIPFIIKTNHDSSGGEIYKSRDEVDLDKLKSRLMHRLNINYYNISGEWQYKNVTPKIFTEKLLMPSDNLPLKDYKVHCFNGVPEFVGVDIKYNGQHNRNYYDALSWKPLDFEWPSGKCPKGKEVEKPTCLEELIVLSQKLSKDFDYVRVDFYILEEKIFFGEITFHDTGGFGKFFPSKYDEIYGEKLKITSLK